MSFFSSLLGNAPKSETDTLIDEVRRLRAAGALSTKDQRTDFLISIMEEAGREFDATLGMRVGVPVYTLLGDLLFDEPFAAPLSAPGDDASFSKEVSFRDRLRLAKEMHSRESHYLAEWRHIVVSVLTGIYTYFPEQAFVDPDQDGNFEEYSRLAPVAPLFTYIKDVPDLVQKTIGTFAARHLQEDGLFNKIRDQIFINCAIASNIPVEDRFTSTKKVILPTDQRGMSDEEIICLYLDGTPFLDIFATPIPMYIPEAVRFEHTHILAGTGHGKTQTLQFLIAGDLEEALKERRSVVVMDSQGDLLQTLMHSPYFADPSLRDRFIYIDPQDVERPVGLNLFDVDLPSASSNAVVRETIINGTIEIFVYFFGGLLGAELTQKQGLVFRYLGVLMTRIPNANVFTLLELMENGDKFKPYMKTLQGSARVFFETRFFDRTFTETKKQILTRLWGVLSSQTLDRMMSATKNSVNLFESLQNGSIVFINTAKDFLGHEGSSIFSRMFIALLGQALIRRAAIPKHLRTPTYIYIDEAEDVVDLKLTQMLTQVRKYKGAMTFAHQNLDQLESSIRAGVLTNTSIKLAGGLSAKDAHALAGDFRCDADFMLSQRRRKNDTSFACFARNVTDQAVTLSIPLGYLESMRTLREDEYQALIDGSRMKYGVPYCEPAARPFGETNEEQASSWLGDESTATPDATANCPIPQTVAQPSSPAVPQNDIVITRAPPSRQSPELRDMGGGGVKHKYIEHLIKELGEERGFRASIEEVIHDGAGRVDVILRRDEVVLAFEISVTTTRDHELVNIEKCLALPFTQVAMLASHQRHLKSLSTFIGNALEEQDKKRVSFLLPEDLPGFLDGYPAQSEPKERTVKGYTVRSRVKDSDPVETMARRKAIAQVVARSIQT